MKNKTKFILFIIFLIALLSLFIAKSIDEDSWICTETGWIEHGKPGLAKPTIPCGKIETELAVEKYLKGNISDISPEKEVLGGKFYITKIDWIGNNSGIIEYEDGHIALKASFDFDIQLDNQKDNYSIIIMNFKIID